MLFHPPTTTFPLYLLRFEQSADLSLHSDTPHNEYPRDWADIACFVKWKAKGHCEHCSHLHNRATWHVLTVHHLNDIKSDCRYVNLIAACQRCHLYIQAAYHPAQQWLFDEYIPPWAKARQIASNPTQPHPG